MASMPKKVLIAEKHPLIALELERILKDIAQCIVSICHGERLFHELEEQAFDLVFVDAEPTKEGHIRQFESIALKGGSVVFLSSYPGLAEQLHQLKPAGVIEKPFDEALVSEQLRQWL